MGADKNKERSRQTTTCDSPEMKDDLGWRWLYAIFSVSVALAVVGHDAGQVCVAPPSVTDMGSSFWCLEGWLNRYQALAAGILATIAAYFTILNLRAQIKQSREVENDRRSRNQIAARALLPIALDALSNYCSNCVTELTSLHMPTATISSINVPSGFRIPDPPLDILNILQNNIKHGNNTEVHKLAVLVALLQIHMARLRYSAYVTASRSGRDQAIYDTLVLQSLIDKLYRYGRRMTAEPNDNNILPEDLKKAAVLANVNEIDFGDVFRLIDTGNCSTIMDRFGGT
jgi:hypothetical protein